MSICATVSYNFGTLDLTLDPSGVKRNFPFMIMGEEQQQYNVVYDPNGIKLAKRSNLEGSTKKELTSNSAIKVIFPDSLFSFTPIFILHSSLSSCT